MAQARKRVTDRVRNIGIMAHIDAGKTTVTERLLFITGRIHRMGEVHEGQATMDWMPQEQERGITITSAVTTFPWQNTDVHLIDTPGHVDFTIEVERSLRVLDGVITVLDGVAGVEPQTETVWRQADRFKVPRFVFINKLDRPGASHQHCLESLNKHYGQGRVILPVQIPIGEESEHRGVVDLIDMEALTWESDAPAETVRNTIPDNLQEAARTARSAMIEKLADVDDDIALMFLEGEAVPAETIREVIRRETLANRVVPVLCGSALKNRGIPPILDAIINYLPSPADLSQLTGLHPETGETVVCELTNDAPLCALAYKVMIMEDGRRMTFVRIYSGRLRVGESVLNATHGFQEKLSRIFVMHANQRQRVESVDCGNIVGVLGLKMTTTGDTLTAPGRPVLLERIAGQEPVIYQAVEPMTGAEKEKLDQTLDKLAEEDPTFRSFEDKGTGERLISGMGELHLEVIVDRLKRQFGLETRVGKPQVVFHETVTASAEEQAIFDRVHEDKRMYGAVTIRVEPLPRGSGVEIRNDCDNELLTGDFLTAVLDGAEQGARSGPVEGHPMDDVRITVIAVGFIEGVSAPIAYRIAAAEAANRACRVANAVRMEPVMSVEIVVPEEYLGNAISAINERRGKVEKMEEQPGYRVVGAMVPLRSMFGFSKDIRTRTQGKGTFSMKFSHYDVMSS